MIGLISLLKEVQGKPKAIILAGSPGAGKGSVTRELDLSKFKILNIDDTIAALSKQDGFTLNQKAADAENRSKFMSAMYTAREKLGGDVKKKIKGDIPQTIENKESFILDGTSASYNQTKTLYNQLIDNGYDVMMLFVYTDLETALDRNEKRFEKSGGKDRSLMPSAVYRTWLQVYKNFDEYKQLFGDNFISVANTGKDETLKDIEKIFQKYIDPFKPADAKPKTEKEQAKVEKLNKELNRQMEEFLNSEEINNIINTSVSKEQAKTKITNFINK
jgi:adenylate kinase family enzyme